MRRLLASGEKMGGCKAYRPEAGDYLPTAMQVIESCRDAGRLVALIGHDELHAPTPMRPRRRTVAGIVG